MDSYKKILVQKPEKKHIEELRKHTYITKLRKRAHRTVKLFVKKFGTRLAEEINISGRIRAVSQKIAGVYMLRAWGMDAPVLERKMSDAINTFKNSYEVLNNAKNNGNIQKKLLKRIKKLLLFFKIKGKSKAYFTPSLISKYSDELFDIATKLTKSYTGAKFKNN